MHFINPELHSNGHTTIMLVILAFNIVVSCILHIAIMFVGKQFFDLKSWIGTQNYILDSIHEGVLIINQDGNGKILYAN